MTECKICAFHYHSARANCPVCGSFQAGKQTWNFHGHELKLVQIATAKGAVRTGQYPNARPNYQTVD